MKKYFIRTIVLFIVAGIYFPIYAQQRNESEKIRFARFTETSTDRKMSKDTVFLKSILNAKNEDEFRLKSETTDDLGITHKRFQQYYKGVKVDNAEYLVHGKGDNIEYINGDFQDINIQSIVSILNEQQALEKALKYVNKLSEPRFLQDYQDKKNHTQLQKSKKIKVRTNYSKKNCTFAEKYTVYEEVSKKSFKKVPEGRSWNTVWGFRRF
jgi:Zn-dependent metalloprotease